MAIINIGIIGIGGVGGYLGALLADCYQNNDNIKISLFARGKTAKILKQNGLTLKSKEVGKTIITKPSGVYDNDDISPKMDYLFICVKSYSINSILERVKEIVNENTIIIPFQNGVNGREILVEEFPNNRVIDGCVYVMSWIESPAVIVENGIIGKTRFFYGDTNGNNEYLEELEMILNNAFNHIHLVDDISTKVWTKFSRISTLSTIQTYYNITSGQILEDSTYKEHYIDLLNEFRDVALALGHKLDDDIIKISLDYIKVSPYEMTTSMQRDYNEGKLSEIEGQTGFIVHKGRQLGVDTPIYSMMYDTLTTNH